MWGYGSEGSYIGRGVEKDALGASGTASGQASGAYGTLAPQLTSMAVNPMGMNPIDKANALTSSDQSIGGSIAGATGYGNLEAARTNNIGGVSGALDDAARSGMVQNSQNALGIDLQNADLKNKQQMFGLQGLGNIYNDANSTNINALNSATGASNNTNASTMGLLGTGLGILGAGQGAAGWQKVLGLG